MKVFYGVAEQSIQTPRQVQARQNCLRRTLFVFCLITVPLLFAQSEKVETGRVLSAGFVCVEKVYNSELMAPFDVLQHSIYRDSSNYIRCFIVTPEGKPFTTSEGIRITPDYAFATVPPIDILVIPSTETSMTRDLENARFMHWLKAAAARAQYVITLCDGAFPLAATGALDGRTATTFPGDREEFAKRFPKISVRFDVQFVVDGKYITSVGGAASYEPALYLMEKLFSREHAARTAQGLVIAWDLAKVRHVIATDPKAKE